MLSPKKILVLKQAKIDLQEGKLFYSINGEKVGDYFYDSLVADIESLWIYSGVHTMVFGLFRMPSKRFPFAIYYTIKEEITIVVAVLDMRRNPSWIRTKLESRIV